VTAIMNRVHRYVKTCQYISWNRKDGTKVIQDMRC